jgi:hypothetical protein
LAKVDTLLRTAGFAPTSQSDLKEFAQIKRFAERWDGDARFRAALPTDPRGVALEYGLQCDPEAVRPLWDVKLGERFRSGAPDVWPGLAQYDVFFRSLKTHRLRVRSGAQPIDPRFAAWRQR